MLVLTPEQYAVLSRPDPHQFAPVLAQEIRQHCLDAVAHLDSRQLQIEVLHSYMHALEKLRITDLTTLVSWVKADVVWLQGELRRDLSVDLAMRASDDPTLLAKDMLRGFEIGLNWKGDI
jgi:hypothetical protein